MNELLDLPPAVLGGVVGAIIGVVGGYFVRRSLDQKALIIQQFQYYHSNAMVKARIDAWEYLRSDRYLSNPKPMSYFYYGDGAKEITVYSAVVQVLNFWHLWSVLNKRRLFFFLRPLARKLLKENYVDWERALKPFLDASKKEGDNLDAQNVLRDLSWMNRPRPRATMFHEMVVLERERITRNEREAVGRDPELFDELVAFIKRDRRSTRQGLSLTRLDDQTAEVAYAEKLVCTFVIRSGAIRVTRGGVAAAAKTFHEKDLALKHIAQLTAEESRSKRHDRPVSQPNF